MSVDRLQKLIIEKKNPTVVGLDPRPDYVPEHIVKKYTAEYGETCRALAEAYLEFNKGLIDALCDIVPAVKPQSACYEQLGWEGVRALAETASYAREKGMYTIADVKRGDIGSTAEAYAEAYLGTVKVGESGMEPFGFDAATVSPYLGSDGIKPFMDVCRERGKMIFVLAKTSNASSSELQDLEFGGRPLYEIMGEKIAQLGGGTEGKYGFGAAGAVVGATHPQQLIILRAALPTVFFLVPGYGAQGGTAEDVKAAFNAKGHGAVINSSRGIICAWKKTGRNGGDYAEAARAEALKMKSAITRFVNIEA